MNPINHPKLFFLQKNRITPSLLISLFIFLLAATGSAQTQNPAPGPSLVSIEVTNTPMARILQMLEQQTSFRFAYSTELIQQQKNVTLNARLVNLSDLLKLLFRGTDIIFSIVGNQIVLQKNELPVKITVSGYIRDIKTGEFLIGASIILPDQRAGTFSNNYGFYSITVPRTNELTIQVSYVGYTNTVKTINAQKSNSFDINLEQPKQAISYVTVVDDKKNEGRLSALGTVDITADLLGESPSVSGGGDIIQAVQMQPGVQAGLDGTPGFFVRGGNTGQNLVQLDEATLYNPSHLFDLVSIFNMAAIKKASLLKSGFPVSYGDHLSSVLDISMKDGNTNQLGGIVQVGSIVSGLTLYGPIKQNKASFLIAARRSMIDLLLQPFDIKSYFSNYNFYDVNAKMSWRFSRRDRIFLSFYKGQDQNLFQDETPDSSAISYGNKFGNQTFTFRWNHLYSQKLFANTSFIYNDYYQSVSAIQDDYYAQLYSGIRDMNIKTDLYYYPDRRHKIRAGLNFLHQKLFPATVSDKIPPSGNITNIKPEQLLEKNSNRVAAYLSDEIKLSPRWNLYAGIRVPLFYNNDVQYLFAEPRVSLQYMIHTGTYVKAAYTQMHQYIHLVQGYNASFPAEIWIGSSRIIQPESSQQFSLAIFKKSANQLFETGLEFYYKKMDNQLLFKGHTQPVIDEYIDDNVIFGKAFSYGAELSVAKKKGKLTGSIAYTLSHAFQQFDSLNLGRKFPFAYDRRHNMHLSAGYALNSHWKMSADLYVSSGSFFTIHTVNNNPGASNNPLYPDDDVNTTNTGPPDIEVNNYQLKPYNRLDLGIFYKKIKTTQHGSLETEWSLSLYNVYAHNNIFLAYRSIDPVTKEAVIKEVSFLPIIPTVTYRCKF